MLNLSPSAKAVLDAFSAETGGVYLEGDPERLAEALRAAVDRCRWTDEYGWSYVPTDRILAIATELETTND